MDDWPPDEMVDDEQPPEQDDERSARVPTDRFSRIVGEAPERGWSDSFETMLQRNAPVTLEVSF